MNWIAALEKDVAKIKDDIKEINESINKLFSKAHSEAARHTPF